MEYSLKTSLIYNQDILMSFYWVNIDEYHLLQLFTSNYLNNTKLNTIYNGFGYSFFSRFHVLYGFSTFGSLAQLPSLSCFYSGFQVSTVYAKFPSYEFWFSLLQLKIMGFYLN